MPKYLLTVSTVGGTWQTVEYKDPEHALREYAREKAALRQSGCTVEEIAFHSGCQIAISRHPEGMPRITALLETE